MIVLHEVLLCKDGDAVKEPISFTFEKKRLTAVIDKPDDSIWELMRVLAGVTEPASGEITFSDKPFGRKSFDLRNKISYVERHPAFDPSMTANEWLTFLGNVKKVPGVKLVKQIRAAIDYCGVKEGMIRNFSEHDRKKLALAGALIGNPSVILLDKPFSAGDTVLNQRIGAILCELAAKKCVVVCCDKNQLGYLPDAVPFECPQKSDFQNTEESILDSILPEEKGETV